MMRNIAFWGLKKTIVLCLSFIFLFISLYAQISTDNHSWMLKHAQAPIFINPDEQYNQSLNFLNSMPKLERYFLHEIKTNNLSGFEIINFADQLLKDRFKHGNGYLDPKKNWVLFTLDFLFKNQISADITSDIRFNAILKSDYAICNQQAMLFQNLMQRTGFEYKSILFDIRNSNEPFGHFASAVKFEEDWYFIDTNMEPKFDIRDASILSKLLNNDTATYNNLYPDFSVNSLQEGSISEAWKNKYPASKGLLLQRITLLISYWGWLFWFFIFLSIRQKNIHL